VNQFRLYIYIYTHIHTHTYMEVPQENSLWSYLKQAKMSGFFFSFTKLENRRVKQVLPGVGGGTSGKGRGGWRRVNMVQILCIHVCKWKNEICWNCSRNQGRGIKKNGEGVDSSMIYLIHCRNFCKCHNVPPPSTTITNFKIKEGTS
jgi:hypothetical protein